MKKNILKNLIKLTTLSVLSFFSFTLVAQTIKYEPIVAGKDFNINLLAEGHKWLPSLTNALYSESIYVGEKYIYLNVNNLGFIKIDKQKMEAVTFMPFPKNSYASSIWSTAIDKEEVLWFIGMGVLYKADNKIERVNRPSTKCIGLISDKAGNIFLLERGYPDAIYTLEGGEWKLVKEIQVDSSSTTGLAINSDDQLIVSTSNSIFTLINNQWIETPVDFKFESFIIDNDDNMLFYYFRDGAKFNYYIPKGAPLTQTNNIDIKKPYSFDSKGNLISNDSYEFIRLNPKTGARTKFTKPEGINKIASLAVDSDDAMWVLTNKSLIKIIDNQWIAFNFPFPTTDFLFNDPYFETIYLADNNTTNNGWTLMGYKLGTLDSTYNNWQINYIKTDSLEYSRLYLSSATKAGDHYYGYGNDTDGNKIAKINKNPISEVVKVPSTIHNSHSLLADTLGNFLLLNNHYPKLESYFYDAKNSQWNEVSISGTSAVTSDANHDFFICSKNTIYKLNKQDLSLSKFYTLPVSDTLVFHTISIYDDGSTLMASREKAYYVTALGEVHSFPMYGYFNQFIRSENYGIYSCQNREYYFYDFKMREFKKLELPELYSNGMAKNNIGETVIFSYMGIMILAKNPFNTPYLELTEIETPPTVQSLGEMTISGNNFGNALGTITLNGIEAKVVSWSENRITFILPVEIESGKVILKVSSNGESDEIQFELEVDKILGNEFLEVDKVYPNPTSGKISIQSFEKINSVHISDQNGKIYKTGFSYIENVYTVSLPSLPSGVYHVVYQTDKSTKSKKVIVL